MNKAQGKGKDHNHPAEPGKSRKQQCPSWRRRLRKKERNEHSIMEECSLFCLIFPSPDDTEACTKKFKISQEIKTQSFKCASYLLSFWKYCQELGRQRLPSKHEDPSLNSGTPTEACCRAQAAPVPPQEGGQWRQEVARSSKAS